VDAADRAVHDGRLIDGTATVPIFHAIVLGLVQGFSEFLPISSSGHLILVPWLFDWNDFDNSTVERTFDVALHFGTLVAVVSYFWHDLVVYVREGVKLVVRRDRPATVEGRLAWYFVLATLPAALVGALFSDQIDAHLGTPLIIGVSLIVFGLVLAWADRLGGRRPVEDFRGREALVVGAAQALALNPGTSRSGITMTAARAIGFGRDPAVRISFLMSIPVIFGACLYSAAGLVRDGLEPDLRVPMLVGMITSGIAGWIAVWGTLRIVRTHSFLPFVVYRIVVGCAVLLIVATGWR
jgi:undecaprenyl-diphosphatase